MQKIGIILYTQGNEKNLKRSIRSLQNFKSNTVIVHNDPLPKLFKFEDFKNILHVKSSNYLSTCYNAGIRQFLDSDVEHIFIINDIIEILDDSVFDQYISSSIKTNIEMFCSSRDIENGKDNNIKLKIDIGDCNLNLCHTFNGMLIYTRKSVYAKVGFFDERFKSAFEVSDLYKRCSDKGIVPPFGWFVDIDITQPNISYNTDSYSTYKFADDIEDRYIRGLKLFYMKYKVQIDKIYDTFSKQDVVNKIKKLASRK
jgi:hypothetical protein